MKGVVKVCTGVNLWLFFESLGPFEWGIGVWDEFQVVMEFSIQGFRWALPILWVHFCLEHMMQEHPGVYMTQEKLCFVLKALGENS
jgi:hypothetical protein